MNKKTYALLDIKKAFTCRIQKRLNRFVVRVERQNEPLDLHINNTGRLEEFMVPGKKAFAFMTPHTRRTAGRLFAVSERGGGALIDTRLQMRSFEQAVLSRIIPRLKGCRGFVRDVRLGTSLIDYSLRFPFENVFCEVKSAVLRENDWAMYPDCPSLRGRRHIQDLTDWVKKGNRGMIFFMAALKEIRAFKPYREADPVLAGLLKKAHEAGVDVCAAGLFYDPSTSTVRFYDPDLPVFLP